MVKGWNVSGFRPATKRVKLNYDYCILCSKKSASVGKLFQHHICDYDNLVEHNSVRNVVLLCALHHRYVAHQGNWGYSLASAHPLRDVRYTNDKYDSAKMYLAVRVAERLWFYNPYNCVGDKIYPLPKRLVALRELYEPTFPKLVWCD